ncbi:MAG: 2-oxo acid dehydrogenase subunit E2, partial [Sphingobacteriales bacterium]
MAKYQLLLPKMGESVAEATIIKWTKNPGDRIEADEAVVEIATDKVDSEVPSPVSGTLVEQFAAENDIVEVGAVIAIIETDEPESEKIAEQAAPAPAEEVKQEEQKIEEASASAESASAQVEELPEISEAAVPPATQEVPVETPVQEKPATEPIPGIEQLQQRPAAAEGFK